MKRKRPDDVDKVTAGTILLHMIGQALKPLADDLVFRAAAQDVTKPGPPLHLLEGVILGRLLLMQVPTEEDLFALEITVTMRPLPITSEVQ